MPADGLRKEASIQHVWKHAIKESGEQGKSYGSNMAKEERSALLIGRRWRARAARRTALSRTRLIERLRLEDSVRHSGVPSHN